MTMQWHRGGRQRQRLRGGQQQRHLGQPGAGVTCRRRRLRGETDAATAALIWNTFLGGSGDDEGNGIAVDGSGNVYVAGGATPPGAARCGPTRVGDDAFVAKLSQRRQPDLEHLPRRERRDYGSGIAVDGSGNVYVTGHSHDTWGSPVRAFTDHIVGDGDAFAAKLSSDGSLTWNTFLGGGYDDTGIAIAVDGSGNVYVAGTSFGEWGSPVQEFAAWYNSTDAFVAKLGSGGSLIWNTFLGGEGSGYDYSLGNDRAWHRRGQQRQRLCGGQ